jgi:hypothetical protein
MPIVRKSGDPNIEGDADKNRNIISLDFELLAFSFELLIL